MTRLQGVDEMPQPRLIQAVVLLTTSGLAAMVTAVLGPVMPQMQQHFAAVPNSEYWVPLTLTTPMLMMAALSMRAGALSDRIGRKRLLVGSTLCYGVLGTAPLYINSLHAIVMSRVALGAMEAVLMTISTTMLGDYYSGAKREKYMALQTTVAAALAFVFNLAGGLLGAYGWRMPYSVYAVGLPLAVSMAVFLWEPVRPALSTAAVRASNVEDVSFKPALLSRTCALAFLCGMAFLIVPVHLGYLFTAVGVREPVLVGMAFAFNSLGVIVGTLCFAWFLAPRTRVSNQVVLCFSVSAAGCLLLTAAKGYSGLTLAAFVNGVGIGLILPTLVTWNMRELPYDKRGLGTGAFQSSLFFGMFVNPVAVVKLDELLLGRAIAVGVVGAAIFLLAMLTVAGLPARRDAATN